MEFQEVPDDGNFSPRAGYENFTSVGSTKAAVRKLSSIFGEQRIYAIAGDVHAAHLALRTLSKIAMVLPIESFCLVGDVIDRSEPGRFGSVKTLDEILRIRDHFGEIKACVGNHEILFTISRETSCDLAQEDGVDTYYAECLRLGGIPKSHLEWIRSLPAFIRLSPRIALAHGGPAWRDRDQPLYEHPIESLAWNYFPYAPDAEPDVTIARGHEVVQFPTEKGRIISLDTGAGFRGPLTLGFISDEAGIASRLLAYAQAGRKGDLIGIYVRHGRND